ncbi:MAG: response regulator [Actinobacteria bacterium]|nr:response regulator [Actinomycetota bacterium]
MSEHLGVPDRSTVVIAEDEPDLRQLIRLRLHRSERFEIVAEAGNGVQAIELATEHQPDVMLLDIRMPEMDGRTALPRIVREAPKTMVVILSVLPANVEKEPALALGAFAYLEKHILDGQELPDHLIGLLGEFRRALDGEDLVAPILRHPPGTPTTP